MILLRSQSASLWLLTLSVLAACGGSESSSTITAARSSAVGTRLTVEGYVTVAPGTFSSSLGNEGFALQDDTAGIYVKLAQKPGFGLGTHVRVTGTVNEDTQQRVLESDTASVETLTGTRQPEAREVSTGGIDESTEGLLVRASGNVTRLFEDESPYGYTVYINDGSGEVQVFVNVSAGFNPDTLRALKLGQRLQVKGLASQYEATYELAPRQPSDLVVP